MNRSLNAWKTSYNFIQLDTRTNEKSTTVGTKIWEIVRTTKIRTSKTKKNSENHANHHNVEKNYSEKNSENSVDDQNVEMVFLVEQNVEIRTSKIG